MSILSSIQNYRIAKNMFSTYRGANLVRGKQAVVASLPDIPDFGRRTDFLTSSPLWQRGLEGIDMIKNQAGMKDFLFRFKGGGAVNIPGVKEAREFLKQHLCL